MRLPLEAKVKLCHKAGAPWSPQDPDAELSQFQVEALGREERLKVIHGGSRLGKSVTAACEALCVLALPGQKIAVVAAIYELLDSEFRYVHDGFLRLFGRGAASRLRCINLPAQKEFVIETIWGSDCKGYSVDRENGQALLGKEWDLAVLGEGSQVDADVWLHKVLRGLDGRIKKTKTSMRRTGRACIYTTPNAYSGASSYEWDQAYKITRGHPEELHVGKVPWPQTVWLREGSVMENPAYDKDVFESRRKSLTKAAFEEQYLGKRVRRSGLVMSDFDKERHLKPLPSAQRIRAMRLGVGIDTGKDFAALLCGLERDGTKWVLDEVYTHEFRTSENADEIKHMVTDALSEAFGTDEWEKLRDYIDLWFVDSNSQDKLNLDEFLDVGLCANKIDWLPTVNKVRDMFASNRLFLNEDIANLPDELGNYLFKENKDARQSGAHFKSGVGRDHAIDCLRFILIPLEDAGPLEPEDVPLTEAQAFEKEQRNRLIGPLLASMKESTMPDVQAEYDHNFGES